VEALEAEHAKTPNARLMQKALAKDITVRVHSETAYAGAAEASEILFGNATTDALMKIDEETLLNVFEGVPQMSISATALHNGIAAVDLLTVNAQVFPSKGEARKMIQGGGVSINKNKIADPMQTVNAEQLLRNKYILIQKGKKNYYLLRAE
jgi:tyrosyl-tRNA synthetase